jgi:hypothetical protein
MADFVQISVSKSARRVLRNPLPLTTLNTIVNGVISGNPWGCIPYTRAGVTMPAVELTRATYTGRVQYQDNMGKVIGEVTVRSPTQSGFTNAIAEVVGNTTIRGLMGGEPIHNPEKDSYSNMLRCCDASGDLYNVTFTRDRVSITSYVEDSLLSTIETWADGISALD